jgi:hypothetical protein
MKKSSNPDFAERLRASSDAKKIQLEHATRAKSEAETPAAIERHAARSAISVARDGRVAERKATKVATESRQAAAEVAARAAEIASREAALIAEQEAQDAEYNERIERQATLEAEQQIARDARYAARKARRQKGR